MKNKKVIIIGAGIGGLATAALLGKAGYDVTILEKNRIPGGRATQWKTKGFTFDMGPSWYLMPDVFENYFALFGKKPEDLFKLTRLDPHYRVYFGKKDYVDIVKNLETNLAYFESIEPGSREKLKKFLDNAEYQYNAAIKHILYKNFTKVTDFFTADIAKEGRKLNVFQNLDKYISTYIKDKKLKQILEYTIVFLGGSPRNTPAFYSIMSHIDFKMGVFYPQKGIFSVIEALISLAKQHGVKIRVHTAVTKIKVMNGKAVGVYVGKKLIPADIVVSNADYPFTEMKLLSNEWQTYKKQYWEKKTLAPSSFNMYLGVKGKLKNLKHHTLSFANDWEKHFDDIFSHPSWPQKPSYYLCCPSKTDATVAPDGYENVFILVPVAPGLADTDKIREKYAAKVIADIEELIGEKFADRIVVKRIYSQRDYSKDYNSYKGSALGLAHTLLQTAIFRPQNRSKKVKNLYYVGQVTQPGIGMPMCLISAQLVSERIIDEYK